MVRSEDGDGLPKLWSLVQVIRDIMCLGFIQYQLIFWSTDFSLYFRLFNTVTVGAPG